MNEWIQLNKKWAAQRGASTELDLCRTGLVVTINYRFHEISPCQFLSVYPECQHASLLLDTMTSSFHLSRSIQLGMSLKGFLAIIRLKHYSFHLSDWFDFNNFSIVLDKYTYLNVCCEALYFVHGDTCPPLSLLLYSYTILYDLWNGLQFWVVGQIDKRISHIGKSFPFTIFLCVKSQLSQWFNYICLRGLYNAVLFLSIAETNKIVFFTGINSLIYIITPFSLTRWA